MTDPLRFASSSQFRRWSVHRARYLPRCAAQCENGLRHDDATPHIHHHRQPCRLSRAGDRRRGSGPILFHPPLIALVIVTAALGVAALFTEGHIGSGVREDRSNRWVIGAFAIIGLADAWLPAFTDRIDFLTFGGEGVRWLGVALYTIGGVLRIGAGVRARAALQRPCRGSGGPPLGHRRDLRRHTPSKLPRLVDHRARVGPGVPRRRRRHHRARTTLPVVVARIRAEERLLSETFGTEYDDYRARTWRLAPYIY